METLTNLHIKTKCPESDGELLMHALGELPYWRSWTLSRHTNRCMACAARRAEMAKLTTRLANTLVPPSGHVRLPKESVSIYRGWLNAILACFVCVFIAILGYVAFNQNGHNPNSHLDTVNSNTLPCGPSVKSDKCR